MLNETHAMMLHPRLSPNGQYVAYEDFGIAVRDLESGKEVFRFHHGRFPCWISSDTLTWVYKTERYEVRIAEGVTPEATVAQSHSDLDGCQFDADGGHWISCVAGRNVMIDGRVVEESNDVVCPQIAGDFAAYAMANENIVRIRDVRSNVVLRDVQIPKGTPVSTYFLHAQGHVAYGTGSVRIAMNGDTDIAVTSAPLDAEAHLHLFSLNDLWLGSSLKMGGKCFVLIRPLSLDLERVHVIETPFHVSHIDMMYSPSIGYWRMVLSNDSGRAMIRELEWFDQPVRLMPQVETPSDNKKWAGYFNAFGQYGMWPEARENCTIVTEEFAIAPALKAGRKIIITHNLIDKCRDVWDNVVAVFVQDALLGKFRDARQSVEQMQSLKLPRRPIMLSLSLLELQNPHRGQYDHVDWVAVDATFRAPQTDSQMSVFWQVIYSRVPQDKRIVIFATGSDFNYAWTNERELASLTPKLFAPLYDDPRTIGIFWYGFGQPGGSAYYARMREWHEALVSVLDAPGVETLV